MSSVQEQKRVEELLTVVNTLEEVLVEMVESRMQYGVYRYIGRLRIVRPSGRGRWVAYDYDMVRFDA